MDEIEREAAELTSGEQIDSSVAIDGEATLEYDEIARELMEIALMTPEQMTMYILSNLKGCYDRRATKKKDIYLRLLKNTQDDNSDQLINLPLFQSTHQKVLNLYQQYLQKTEEIVSNFTSNEELEKCGFDDVVVRTFDESLKGFSNDLEEVFDEVYEKVDNMSVISSNDL